MEWKKLIDKALGTNFDAPVYDPQKGRDKLAKVIDTAAKQHSEGSTRAPNRAWKAGGNNAIRFVPVLNGNQIMLDEGKPAYVPAEHFQKFLTQLKASVQAGDLDKEIKAALDSEKGKGASSSASTAKRAPAKDTGDKYPKELNPGYADLTDQQKRNVGRWWKMGKNPDQSERAEVGDKPDAPYADPTK